MKPEKTAVKILSFINKVSLAGYGLYSLSVALATIYFICLCYYPGPFRDMWIAMDLIRSSFEHAFTIPDLFSLHGGAHRLVIPRLFFLIEYGVFSGSNVFLISVSILVQCSVVWLIWSVLGSEKHITVHYRWFLTAMALVLMFNATQLENFVYTFDMQWFVTSAAALWALHFWNQFFKTLQEKNIFSAGFFIFSLLLTAISMWSSFSGLCVLLVLPLLSRAYRLPFRHMAVLCGLMVLVIAGYIRGPFAEEGMWISADTEIGIQAYLQALFDILLLWIKWIALYFGSPLGRSYFWAGALFSYGSLLFICWYWLKAMTKGASHFTAFQMLALAIALFAAMVGISTGLGRMYFVNTADEDRYQSIVLVYWLGVFGFSLSRALQIEVHQKISRYRHACIALIIFWSGVVLPIASIKDAKAQIDFFDRVNNASLAVATGQWAYDDIKDTLILGDKWQKKNRPEKHASFLREKKWGVFASPEYALLGTMIDRHFISADQCEGGIDAVEAVSAPYRGYRIRGHGQDVQNESALSDYVAIDAAGRVIGLGRLQRQKNSLLPLAWQPAEQAQWLLYTQRLVDTSSLQILGKLAEGGYCTMASAKLPSPDP